MVARAIAYTLKSKDYEILQAGTGEDALVISRKMRPDVILMDIMMPGDLNGIEATRMLKADVRTKQSKVIILTSSGTLKEIAMSAGADAYFSKPFSPLELLRKIDEFLDETYLGRGEELRLSSSHLR